MGGNESREAGESERREDGEGGIYRDLLEVDGCESLWMDKGEERGELGDENTQDATKGVTSGVDVDVKGVEYGREEEVVSIGGDKGKQLMVEEARHDEKGELAEELMARNRDVGRVSILTTDDGELLLTKGGRPLAEPPIFDYERFVEDFVPSPGKLKIMFGDDIAMLTVYRDWTTETQLLKVYWEWALDTQYCSTIDLGNSDKRCKFYSGLRRELNCEGNSLISEATAWKDTISPLQEWEGAHLDNDDENGNIMCIQTQLHAGFDLFSRRPSEVRIKYGSLLKTVPWPPVHTMDTWLCHQVANNRVFHDGNVQPFDLRTGRPGPLGAEYFGGDQANTAFHEFERQLDGRTTDFWSCNDWPPGEEAIVQPRLAAFFRAELSKALKAALESPESSPLLRIAAEHPGVWKCTGLEQPQL